MIESSENAKQTSIFVDRVAKELFDKFKSSEKIWGKDYLSSDTVEKKIEKEIFDEALKADNYEKFRDDVISKIAYGDLCVLHKFNNLTSLPNNASSNSQFGTEDLRQATGVEAGGNYEGVCIYGKSGDEKSIGTEDSSKVFSMHSVGKVFTGILITEMIAKGVIPQEELEKVGVSLDPDVMQKLPNDVQDQLKKVTLHQLMTHQANLPDYLGNYDDDIKRSVACAEPVPSLESPQDFLKYIKGMEYEDGKIKENEYSNVGILLAGLAVEHYYNKGRSESERKTYNEILKEFILEPAGIENFLISPPKEGLFSEDSITHKHISGSPAGGYWASADDMLKFGEYIHNKMRDEEFSKAMSTYGGEFYNPETGIVQHRGELGPGEKTSAFFAVNTKTGEILIMVANTDHAGFIGEVFIKGLIEKQRDMRESSRRPSASPESPRGLRQLDPATSPRENSLGESPRGSSGGSSGGSSRA